MTEGGQTSLGTVEQEGRRVAEAAGLMGGLTLVSRLLGLARDVGQAAVLGTGLAADAFTLAFVLPNILRRLFGESTVSAAFVPTYTATLVRGGAREGSRLGSTILSFSFTCLAAATVAGIVAAPLLVRLFAPGFSAVAGKAELSAGLLRLLFPYVLFVGLAAIVMGILNSARHFLTPALGPILFNILSLGGLFVLPLLWTGVHPVWAYSTGVLAGGVIQLLVQIPALVRRGFRFRFDMSLSEPGAAAVLKLAVPALAGLVAAEVNVLVDQMVASLLEEGSVAALSYGNRIMQFPLGIFAVALATALLPTLSRQAALGRMAEARRTLGYATLGLAVLLVPATIYIAVLAREIITAILARGAFDSGSIGLTSSALVFYSVGLLFYGGVKITAPVFYAARDTRTPAKIGILCMGVNIPLNILLSLFFIRTGLARPLAGVALATSASSMLNFVLLRISLAKLPGAGGWGGTGAGWRAVAFGSAACTAVLLALKGWVAAMCATGTAGGLLALAAAAAASFGVFLAAFAALGGRSAANLARFVKRRGRNPA